MIKHYKYVDEDVKSEEDIATTFTNRPQLIREMYDMLADLTERYTRINNRYFHISNYYFTMHNRLICISDTFKTNTHLKEITNNLFRILKRMVKEHREFQNLTRDRNNARTHLNDIINNLNDYSVEDLEENLNSLRRLDGTLKLYDEMVTKYENINQTRFNETYNKYKEPYCKKIEDQKQKKNQKVNQQKVEDPKVEQYKKDLKKKQELKKQNPNRGIRKTPNENKKTREEELNEWEKLGL